MFLWKTVMFTYKTINMANTLHKGGTEEGNFNFGALKVTDLTDKLFESLQNYKVPFSTSPVSHLQHHSLLSRLKVNFDLNFTGQSLPFWVSGDQTVKLYFLASMNSRDVLIYIIFIIWIVPDMLYQMQNTLGLYSDNSTDKSTLKFPCALLY